MRALRFFKKKRSKTSFTFYFLGFFKKSPQKRVLFFIFGANYEVFIKLGGAQRRFLRTFF